MASILKTYPLIFNYKTISLNVTEKDEHFMLELTSKNMIHLSYSPQTNKGNKMTAKVILGTSDRTSANSNGVSMHITFNSEYGWFCGITETDSSIVVEFHTGEHQFLFDQTIKSIQHNNVYIMSAKIPK